MLDHSAGYLNHSLFQSRTFVKLKTTFMRKPKYFEPFSSQVQLPFGSLTIKANTIKKSGDVHLLKTEISLEMFCDGRAKITDLFLALPGRFSAPFLFSEKIDFFSIGLGVIPVNHAQDCGFSGTIRTV